MTKKFPLLLLLLLSLLSCSKDLLEERIEEATRKAEATDPQYRTKDFVWKGLNEFYLWQEQVTDLSDTRFEKSVAYTNATSSNYVSYRSQFSPKTLFEH